MGIVITDEEWERMQRQGYRKIRDLGQAVDWDEVRMPKPPPKRQRSKSRGDVTLSVTADHDQIQQAVLKGTMRPERWESKTEARYALLLRARLADGRISACAYQPVTFTVTVKRRVRRYTPDFIAILPDGSLLVIEVKGSHIWPGALERYDLFIPHLPRYEIWQYRGKGIWREVRR